MGDRPVGYRTHVGDPIGGLSERDSIRAGSWFETWIKVCFSFGMESPRRFVLWNQNAMSHARNGRLRCQAYGVRFILSFALAPGWPPIAGPRPQLASVRRLSAAPSPNPRRIQRRPTIDACRV